ncbi:hypothetical protein CO2235_MP120023 [Cupriavidus oxalaticus]|uniref:Uncharacterized protein n=1 Tax=Cupriavidus oxalaticus TaxID=96344 RepID=A0A375GJG1_9BURK|nr:hypothetical protein CO2235_MP120023 [Cupriavidus oxalaticus]
MRCQSLILGIVVRQHSFILPPTAIYFIRQNFLAAQNDAQPRIAYNGSNRFHVTKTGPGDHRRDDPEHLAAESLPPAARADRCPQQPPD